MGKSKEVKFREDILAPTTVLTINYAGKDPFWICTAALNLLRNTLKISSINLREDDVRWDVTGEMREFYGIWRAYRDEDIWTKSWVKIRAHGFINKEHMGNVGVRLEGWLETEFKRTNSVQYWMWIMYNYLFYWRQRRTYIDTTKDDILSMKEQIMRAYGILKE